MALYVRVSFFSLMTTQLGTGGNPIFDLNFKKYKHIDRFVTRFDDKISKLKLKEKTYDKGETIFYAGQVTNGEAYSTCVQMMINEQRYFHKKGV